MCEKKERKQKAKNKKQKTKNKKQKNNSPKSEERRNRRRKLFFAKKNSKIKVPKSGHNERGFFLSFWCWKSIFFHPKGQRSDLLNSFLSIHPPQKRRKDEWSVISFDRLFGFSYGFFSPPFFHPKCFPFSIFFQVSSELPQLDVGGFSWAENQAFDSQGNLFVSDTTQGT